MNSKTFWRMARHALVAVLSASMLVACGGGGEDDDNNALAATADAPDGSPTAGLGAGAGASATNASLGVRARPPQCDPADAPPCGLTLPPTE